MLNKVNNPPTNDLKLRFMRYIYEHLKEFRSGGVSVPVTISSIQSDYGITKDAIEQTLLFLENSSCNTFAYWTPENSKSTIDVLVSVDSSFENIYLAYESIASSLSATEIADSHTEVIQKPQDAILASLNVKGHSTFVVTVENKSYKVLGTNTSQVSDIVSSCILERPNKYVDLKSLRELLKSNSKAVGAIPNVKEKIRKSVFGSNGILSPFIEAEPGHIKVKTSTYLTKAQLAELLSHVEQM